MSRQTLPGVMTPGTVGVMTRKPADDTYSALCLRHAALLKEAGALLARCLDEDTAALAAVSRRIAEDFAREANEVADQMKTWRLANGWDA